MSRPLVTCLCLTMAGRKEFLKRAVECFNRQTYQNRELLIVADSFDDASVVLDGSRMSVYVPRDKSSLGSKRNLGCEDASGDIIATWDDDDYSAPERLAQQIQELELSGKSVTGYYCMKFTDGVQWWQFCYPKGFVLGTSLCFKRDWWVKHRYPEIDVGEEALFCEVAALNRQLTECGDLNLMYATIHDGNTSKRKTRQGGWRDLPANFRWSDGRFMSVPSLKTC